MHNFMKVHAEAESNNRGLQQEFRQTLAFDMEGMSQGESVNQPTEKSDRWRDQTTGRQN